MSFLDGDTIISPGSKEATTDAVGSIITAINGIQNKEIHICNEAGRLMRPLFKVKNNKNLEKLNDYSNRIFKNVIEEYNKFIT